MALFIDESNKDRITAKRKYGWSPVGKPVYYKNWFNQKILTLIVAADMYGFVLPACETILHRNKEKEEKKPVVTERFIQYVKNLFILLGNCQRNKDKWSVVIWDNCGIHVNHEVCKLIEDAGVLFLYILLN